MNSKCLFGYAVGETEMIRTEKLMNLSVWASMPEWEKAMYGLGWTLLCIGAIVAGIALVVLGRKG
jgi:hypothetical protein